MVMKKPIVIANWKMNLTLKEAEKRAFKIKSLIRLVRGVEVVLCPSFISLDRLHQKLKGSLIRLGAQNCALWEEGAYTGEISALMLADLCQYVILGHSERRNYFGETNSIIALKTKRALEAGLSPILCLGETLKEKKSGQTKKVITQQLKVILGGLKSSEVSRIVFAYEPIWAISSQGQGEAESPLATSQIVQLIRAFLTRHYSQELACCVRIIYGGSVTERNVLRIKQEAQVDGVLVGASSLDPQKFSQIVKVFAKR